MTEPRTSRRTGWGLCLGTTLFGLASVLAGCQAELSAGLDEAQADAIVLALDAAAIGAERERDGSSEPARYRVLVAHDEVPAALAVMRQNDLPREREASLAALYEDSSLIPSATEERARHAAAVGGELARSLEAMEGIARARVHLALPDPNARPLDDAPARARASVLIEQRAGNRADEEAIRSLVAGAVQGLDAEAIAVVSTPAPERHAAEPTLAWVGPIAVSRGSAPTLRGVLAASFTLNLLLAVGLVLSRRRARAETKTLTTNEITNE